MVISMRTIHTRRRREARELWDAASDEGRTVSQRRRAYGLFLQRIDMLPAGSSMADINVTPAKRDALGELLEMDPISAERRHRTAVGMFGLAFLLLCIFGLAWSTDE